MSLPAKAALILSLSLWSHIASAETDSSFTQVLLKQLSMIDLDYQYSPPAWELAWNLEELLYANVPLKDEDAVPAPDNWRYQKYTLDFNVGYRENQLSLTTVLPSPVQWPVLYGTVRMVDEKGNEVLKMDLQERVLQLVETEPLDYFLEQEELLEYLCEVLSLEIYRRISTFFTEKIHEN